MEYSTSGVTKQSKLARLTQLELWKLQVLISMPLRWYWISQGWGAGNTSAFFINKIICTTTA